MGRRAHDRTAIEPCGAGGARRRGDGAGGMSQPARHPACVRRLWWRSALRREAASVEAMLGNAMLHADCVALLPRQSALRREAAPVEAMLGNAMLHTGRVTPLVRQSAFRREAASVEAIFRNAILHADCVALPGCSRGLARQCEPSERQKYPDRCHSQASSDPASLPVFRHVVLRSLSWYIQRSLLPQVLWRSPILPEELVEDTNCPCLHPRMFSVWRQDVSRHHPNSC